jgi:hypothetical protein
MDRLSHGSEMIQIPWIWIQVVQEVPEESCNLRAQPYCRHVTKLVPM